MHVAALERGEWFGISLAIKPRTKYAMSSLWEVLMLWVSISVSVSSFSNTVAVRVVMTNKIHCSVHN